MSCAWATAAWLKAAKLEARLMAGVPTTSPPADTLTSTLAGVTRPPHEGGGGSSGVVVGLGRVSQQRLRGIMLNDGDAHSALAPGAAPGAAAGAGGGAAPVVRAT